MENKDSQGTLDTHPADLPKIDSQKLNSDDKIDSQKPKTEDNIIFIGSKPFMNYVTSVVVQFTNKNSPDVIIKARGKFISKAVDVSEVARKRFLKEHNISVKDIKIDTEEYEKEGRKINVSTIDISLTK
jgi:archaea-specific DNA-binding protein